MLNVYVIGCGGIGGYLINMLPMVISSLSLDFNSQNGYLKKVEYEFLENAGRIAMPCIVDRLVLVDADVFVARNVMRQGAGHGGKLVGRLNELDRYVKEQVSQSKDAGKILECIEHCNELRKTQPDVADRIISALYNDFKLTDAKVEKLKRQLLCASYLQNMQIIGYNAYVTPDNIAEIIPTRIVPNSENEFPRSMNEFEKYHSKSPDDVVYCHFDSTVVFICVDNMKTRYEVSKYMEAFDNCLVLNGGNSKTSGHVTVYERYQGEELDPPIYKVYPNVSDTVDQRPDEIECGSVAPQHDQLAITNSLIANIMLTRFVTWVRSGLTTTVAQPGGTSNVRYNEILIDIETPSIVPLYHPL